MRCGIFFILQKFIPISVPKEYKLCQHYETMHKEKCGQLKGKLGEDKR